MTFSPFALDPPRRESPPDRVAFHPASARRDNRDNREYRCAPERAEAGIRVLVSPGRYPPGIRPKLTRTTQIFSACNCEILIAFLTRYALGAQHHTDLCHPRMAAHQARHGQAALARHLQKRRASLRCPLTNDQHVHKTLRHGHQHRIFLPARSPHNSRHIPFKPPSCTHTHHVRYLWHISMLWQRPRPRIIGQRETRLARNGC